ncbi:MAG: hypothetical protein JO257_03615 [Deltaproteobacteria bacterium]|nr:hypothetical protein [Deltaproteobacteria bacterium]
MSTGLPARVAVVCAALGAVAAAQPPDRRKVAVVELTDDPKATALRGAFYDELQVHWQLRPLGNNALETALEGSFLDEDKPHLDLAKRDLQLAEDALAQFDYRAAQKNAEGARVELAWVTPTVALPLYVDATLMLGQAELAASHNNQAAQAFALVHRLDPLRQLDPGRYLPEIVQFYNEHPARTDTVKLQVIGHGRVWIDGTERGTAPGTFDVGGGEHLVQLTGPDRVTRGESVDKDSVEIPDQPASAELQVQRARLALYKAPDPSARAGRMQELAKLLDVHDAVLIDVRDGALVVQTWKDRAPGFSEFVTYHDQDPTELLVPLAPAKNPEEPKITIPFNPPPKTPEEPWWQARWVQGSAALGATIVVVGIVLYATRDQYIQTPTSPGFVNPPTSSR